jgi:hypothetical protein
MKAIRYYKKSNKVCLYVGFVTTFQGIGITLSFDNPMTVHDYILFEVLFLWFKFWVTYDYESE